MKKLTSVCLLLPFLTACDVGSEIANVPVVFEPTEELRRPAALILLGDGTLLTANRASGSVSAVDTRKRTVTGEWQIGHELVDLSYHAPSDKLVAADREADEVLQLEWKNGVLSVRSRVTVDASPNRICFSEDGDQVFVSNQWAHRLTVLALRDQGLQVDRVVDLPFPPRELLLLPDGEHLCIAAAFGGRLVVLDLKTDEIVSERDWNAHNLRGLAVGEDKKSILVTHQALMSDSPTTSNSVHWGAVMMNLVRNVSLDALFSPQPPRGAFLDYLGTMDDAAGDPEKIVVTPDGRRVVAIAGTNEVAVSEPGGDTYRRAAVGKRPTALALAPDGQTVYSANTFSDSISIVDVSSVEVVGEIALGPTRELTMAQKGELLFHNADLSSDGWFSCHSCHTDGHSNGFLNDNFGDESTGAPKRVPTLLGASDTPPYAWNGQVPDLLTQVHRSIRTTMRGPELSEEDATAIVEYVETLPPPPSRSAARKLTDDARVASGASLFAALGCSDCHRPPTYTSEDVYNVGLKDEAGETEFNPPSLRGVSQRHRLFHDGRAFDLHEVLVKYQHQLEDPLSEEKVAALQAFLESL